MKKTTASVVIPTFNYANLIGRAIDSILAQTYPSELIDIIVVDDGSTDQTADVLKQFPMVKYHYQENNGKAAATQKGIELANGEILFNLDADDYFVPEKIAQVIAKYEQDPTLSFVGHPAIITQSGRPDLKEKIPENLLHIVIPGIRFVKKFLTQNVLYGGGSTFSARTMSLKKRPIPPAVDMYIDEYLIYAALADGSGLLLDEPLSHWHVHGNNYSLIEPQSQQVKNERLVKSSKGMLDYVSQENLFDSSIKEIYLIKHLDRVFSSKEQADQKTLSDIIRLAKSIPWKARNLPYLRRYHLAYRFIPTPIVNFLKKWKASK